MSAFDTQTETLFLTSQRLSTTNLILQNRTVQLIHREHYRGGAKTVTLCLSRYNKILGSRATMTKILFSTREDNVRTLKPPCECSTTYYAIWENFTSISKVLFRGANKWYHPSRIWDQLKSHTWTFLSEFTVYTAILSLPNHLRNSEAQFCNSK